MGEGSLHAALLGQARREGIAEGVIFTGFRSDIPRILDATDVLALPSLHEGTPLTEIETAAAGRPVVVTAVDGTPEVVRDGETGYPLLLAALSRRRPPPGGERPPWPFLSVIVAAHNEAACIRAKLASALENGYPGDGIEVIVISDASSDSTDRLVAGCGDVLVFTDANARFAPGALERLAAPFADPRAGLVSGHGLYATPETPDAQAVANGYVRVEAFLKSREAALGVLAGADGAIYALRRALYRDLGPAEVNDLAHAIETAVAGYAARFDAAAYTVEPPSAHAGQEFRRHVRIVAQNARLLQDRLAGVVGARRLRLLWALLSHRVLRWLTAPALATVLGANVVLVGAHPVYTLTLLGQGAFYALALAGLVGLARYLRGGARAVWAPGGQPAREARMHGRAA